MYKRGKRQQSHPWWKLATLFSLRALFREKQCQPIGENTCRRFPYCAGKVTHVNCINLSVKIFDSHYWIMNYGLVSRSRRKSRQLRIFLFIIGLAMVAYLLLVIVRWGLHFRNRYVNNCIWVLRSIYNRNFPNCWSKKHHEYPKIFDYVTMIIIFVKPRILHGIETLGF